MKSFRWILGVLAVLAIVSVSQADVPTKMSYQGYLEQDGQAVSGTHQMTFLLYDQLTGGAHFWMEEKSLTVADGLLQTYLGDATALPSDLYAHTQLFLSVVIEGDTLSPRTELASVPYAFLTQMANQAVSSQTAQEATLADSARAASHAETADYATHAAYADSSGTGGGGDSHWAESNGNIYNTNPGYIGFGTSNPGYKFHFDGGSAMWPFYLTGSHELMLVNGLGNVPLTERLFQVSNAVGTEFCVLGNGNVGIGTTLPITRLHVDGHSDDWAARFTNSLGDNSSDVRLAYKNGEGLFIVSSGSTEGYLAHLSHETNSRFLVRKDGKVGIGTANPAHALDVNGDVRVQGGEIFGINGIQGMGNVLSGWYSDNTNLAARIPGANGYFGVQNNGATLTYFWADADGFGSYQDGFVGGNLGVGTTDPTEKLQVVGRIHSASGGFKFPDGTVQTTAAGTSYWAGSGNDIYSTNSGNVGVGTSTPQSRFTVQCQQLTHRGLRVTDGTANSNIIIQPLPGENSGFQAINFNGYYDGTEVRLNPNKNLWRMLVDQRGAVDQFFIDTEGASGGTRILTAMTDGRVGMGTADPENKLHVRDNTSLGVPVLRVVNEGQGHGILVRAGTASVGSQDQSAIEADNKYEGENATYGVKGITRAKGKPNPGGAAAVGVYGMALDTGATVGGATFGVLGRTHGYKQSGSNSSVPAGVFGEAVHGSGIVYGLEGDIESSNADAAAVKAISKHTTGSARTILAENNSVNGTGVYIKMPNSSALGLYCIGRIEATGGISMVQEDGGEMRESYVSTSTEGHLSDLGRGQLVNGIAHVELDPLFLELVTISDEYPLIVNASFLGPHGNWYYQPGKTGFDIIDPSGSSSGFTWEVKAKRRGYENKRLEIVSRQGSQPEGN
ncbi:MAG: hypothetical protein PHI73_02750 [Patescibacteria group bacterium]|nr:hypothetical protein [Patescibacteria group bacterium]